MKKQCCPTCGQGIAKRKITFSRCLLSALIKAYRHAMKMRAKHGRGWGNMVKISDLNLTTTEYANMNNLVRFGLAYKEDDWNAGTYGLPLSRIWKFLNGEWTVAAHCFSSRVDTRHNEMSVGRVYVHQVPSIKKIQEEFGAKMTEYKFNDEADELEATTLPQQLFSFAY